VPRVSDRVRHCERAAVAAASATGTPEYPPRLHGVVRTQPAGLARALELTGFDVQVVTPILRAHPRPGADGVAAVVTRAPCAAEGWSAAAQWRAVIGEEHPWGFEPVARSEDPRIKARSATRTPPTWLTRQR
jgi:hypothetical protein